jgi:Putative zinc-finger
MECRAVVSSLSDYIDSCDIWLSESEVQDIESHLVGCSKCQQVKLDLTEIKSAARELPLHTPPGALWTRIANELEAELPRSERPTRIEMRTLSLWERVKARRLTFTLPQLTGALAFAVVLIFLGFLSWPNRTPDDLDLINISGAQTALLQDEDQIKAEIERKLSVINVRKEHWDPQVRAEFETNLSKIEESLSDSRRKLQANPGDRIQQQMVLTLYNEKRQLLEDMERLKW